MLRQPSWTRLLPERLVLNLATLGPLGRFPAPGTWGSLAGLIGFTVLCAPAGPAMSALLVGGLLYLGYAVCGEAELRLRKVDPPEVILDECVCMPIVLFCSWDHLATSGAWAVYLLAFGLFRLFDILKPAGIARLQRFRGGLGVVLDDFAAAIAALIILQLLTRLTPLMDWLGGGSGPLALE
jgi:phosphatidylglycerophosphatase A